MAYELLTRYWVLPIGQTLEVLLSHFAVKTPFLCQSAMPFAAYPIALGAVVLLRIGEFSLVIGNLCATETAMGSCNYLKIWRGRRDSNSRPMP
jgi:hypothetical protein